MAIRILATHMLKTYEEIINNLNFFCSSEEEALGDIIVEPTNIYGHGAFYYSYEGRHAWVTQDFRSNRLLLFIARNEETFPMNNEMLPIRPILSSVFNITAEYFIIYYALGSSVHIAQIIYDFLIHNKKEKGLSVDGQGYGLI